MRSYKSHPLMIQTGKGDLYLTSIQRKKNQNKSNQTSKSKKKQKTNQSSRSKPTSSLHDPNVEKGILQDEKTII